MSRSVWTGFGVVVLLAATWIPAGLAGEDNRAGGYRTAFRPSENGGDFRPEEGKKVRIDWRTDVLAAYKEACREHKPMVVYFHEDYCEHCHGRPEWCARLEADVLSNDRFHALAGRAVFVWQDTSKDDAKGNVKKLVTESKVERSPQVVVYDVSASEIKERDRVIGYFPLDKYLEKIVQILDASPESGGQADRPNDRVREESPSPAPAASDPA